MRWRDSRFYYSNWRLQLRSTARFFTIWFFVNSQCVKDIGWVCSCERKDCLKRLYSKPSAFVRLFFCCVRLYILDFSSQPYYDQVLSCAEMNTVLITVDFGPLIGFCLILDTNSALLFVEILHTLFQMCIIILAVSKKSKFRSAAYSSLANILSEWVALGWSGNVQKCFRVVGTSHDDGPTVRPRLSSIFRIAFLNICKEYLI
jgi:hypothetical protein